MLNRFIGLCFGVCLLGIGVELRGTVSRIEVGVLKIDVSISRTATLFHVVDQLAEWSVFCHREYGRAFAPLTAKDRAMLQKHAAVRARHGWGAGLEQTLYSDLPVDQALQAGVEAKWLTPDEAVTEREVLSYFAPRIDAMAAAQSGTVTAFRDRLQTELQAAAPMIAQFARFTGTVPEVVPVFLLPDPDPRNGGGGYNGGRLTLEIPATGDALGTALHEIFHAFLHPRMHDLERAAAGVPNLDAGILNEGMAYAFSPGLFHSGSQNVDVLANRVATDYANGKPLSDPYVRSNRYGLALRPLLRMALTDSSQTLDAFLPRAVDVWRALGELGGETQAMELRTVTILRLLRAGSPELPEFVRTGSTAPALPTEYFASTKEWVPGTYRQMGAFYKHAGHDVVLVGPDKSEIRAHFNGHSVSQGDGSFQAFALEIVAEDRAKIIPDAGYMIRPINTNAPYQWVVSDQFVPVKLKD